MVSALVVIAAVVATLFFGVLPVILVITGHYLLGLIGWVGIAGSVLVFLSVLLAALVSFRGSVMVGIKDFLAFCLVFAGWVVSKIAGAIRRLGSIFSLLTWTIGGLGQYPGRGFIEDRREDLVQRGIRYYEQQSEENKEDPENHARQIRACYANAGRSLSNGEAVLGITLAVVVLLPSSSPITEVVPWIHSPLIIAGLSAALVFIVTIRLAALDLVLIRDPPTSAHPARLAVYAAWNQTMSSGTELVKLLFMIRVVHTISESAYEFYLDWVFDRNFNGNGVGQIELIHELRRPLIAFIFAEWDNVSPVEASKNHFGWNVYGQFDFGPGANDSPVEPVERTHLDSVLLWVLSMKAAIQQIARTSHVHRMAREQSKNAEEVSKELYGENILKDRRGGDDIPNRTEKNDE